MKTNRIAAVILCTDANLPDAGWGFIEQSYKLYKYGSAYDPIFLAKVQAQRESIKGTPEWVKAIEHKAKARGISTDSMITLDAIWLVQENDKKK